MADKKNAYEWWKNTPGPKNFLQEVVRVSVQGKSAVIDVPVQDLEGFLRVFSDEMSLLNLSPSVELMENVEASADEIFDAVTERFAIRYRRDFSVPEFQDLAEQDGVQGAIIFIPVSNADMVCDAVDDYNAVDKGTIGSIFYVTDMVRSSLSAKKILIRDYISQVDVQFFVLRLLQSEELTPMQRWYVALLSTKIATRLLMSASLLNRFAKRDLYFETKEFLHGILVRENFVEAKDFDRVVDRLIWETQIQLIMPIIERVREQIIERNEDYLKKLLPIKDEYGNEMWEPLDMEFRNIKHHGFAGLSSDDKELVEQMNNIRNELSHLKILTLEKLEEVLKLSE